MDILAQSALILSVAAFTLATTAMSRNLRNKLVLTYALLCACVCFWAFTYFLDKVFGGNGAASGGAFYRFHLLFNLTLAPMAIFFISLLTRVETRFSIWLYRSSLTYLFVVGLLLFSLWGDSLIVNWMAILGPTFLVIECFYLMYRERQLQRGRLPNVKVPTVGVGRRHWIYAGGLVLLLMSTMDHIPGLGEELPSIGNILIGIYLFFISEAILHQRLLNWTALMNRVLVLVAVSVCFTVIFTSFVAWIDRKPGLFLLNTFFASFIILLLAEPLKKLVAMVLMRILSKKYLELERDLSEAEKHLSGVLDTYGLSQVTLQFLEKTLRFESATFFVLRSDGSKLRRIRGVRDDQLENREILSNHPIVQFFVRMKRRGDVPVLLDFYLENEIDRSTSQAQRELYEITLGGLRGLNANIAIPFIDGNSVLGFVAVLAHNPPEPWGNSWGLLTAMNPFFQQATRVLKNMDVYVRLREKDRLAALGEMAAGLAHEIRNPLGAIKGAAQYLETDGTQNQFLKVIVEEVNRLNNVVTQFLDYSRPSNIDLKPNDIGPILEKTLLLFSTATDPLPPIELQVPEEGFQRLPQIKCVPEQIKQVLVNLIQNSVQAIRTKFPENLQQGRVRFGARFVPQNYVEIFVEDNGPGIDRANLEKIFIPFFTTSPQGTGLGLSICARIIEEHGGRIEANSEEGRFTRFSVYLPPASEG